MRNKLYIVKMEYKLEPVNVVYENEYNYFVYKTSSKEVKSIPKSWITNDCSDFKETYKYNSMRYKPVFYDSNSNTNARYEAIFISEEVADEYIQAVKKYHDIWDMEFKLQEYQNEYNYYDKKIKEYEKNINDTKDCLNRLRGLLNNG